jgi:hypothetical protein
MFMGVITQPQEEHNFSGAIKIKWLSEQQQLQRDNCRSRFHLDYHMNQLIVNGEWRHLHDDPTHTVDELSHLIAYFINTKLTSKNLCASDI